MKKQFLTIIVLMLAIGFAKAQSTNDQASVLKKCLDLPAVQQLYPTDSKGQPQPVYIMQHAVSFPNDIPVSKFGQKLVFLTKDDMIESNVEAFILFERFEITGNTADVIMLFNRNQGNGYEASEFQLQLSKNSTSWSVVESNAKMR